VQEAGLQGLCADVSLDTLNIAPARVAELIDEGVLAVVAPHMFGVPCDIAALRDICQERGVHLIEDCAQCVGGRWQGQRIGTFGDVAFLSMGRSKNLRGYEGGIVWINRSDLVGPLSEEFEQLPDAPVGTKDKLRQAAITVLSTPGLWAAAKRLPGLKVGAEDQSFDPHPSKLADWQAGLGLASLERLEEFNERRRELAEHLRDALTDVAGIRCQTVPDEAEPTCLRFAALLSEDHADQRDALVAKLQSMDIDARAFYARPMREYSWWRASGEQPPDDHAREVVRRNLVLPLPHTASEAQIIQLAETVAAKVSDTA
jgi:dTDP-4-amino-4,6-dideoxygalactose transaminase